MKNEQRQGSQSKQTLLRTKILSYEEKDNDRALAGCFTGSEFFFFVYVKDMYVVGYFAMTMKTFPSNSWYLFPPSQDGQRIPHSLPQGGEDSAQYRDRGECQGKLTHL